jgi:hypothetical protein
MDIGDWKATERINEPYRRLRELGLEASIAEFEAFGFTVIPPQLVAPAGFVDRVRSAVLEVAHEATGVEHHLDQPGDRGHYKAWPPSPSQYVLYFMALRRQIFGETLLHPVADAFASYVLGADYRLTSQTAFVKWGDSYGASLGLHADGPAGARGELPAFALAMNVTWTLTDYTKDNGALAIVPGSHRLLHRPDLGDMADLAIPVEAPAGSLIIWHANTWHGAYPKTTRGLRLTLVNVLCRPNVKTQEDYRAALTPEVRADLPYRLIEILNGFDYLGWSEEGPQYDAVRALAQQAALNR